MPRSFSSQALILKHSKTGEADKIVTVLTSSHGKLVAVAKGVRKLTSSKKALLETGNLVQAFFVTTKSMPLLTQARLIQNTGTNLDIKKIRQLTHFLEIINSLFVEEEIGQELFDLVIETRNLVLSSKNQTRAIRENFDQLLQIMGYQNLKDSGYSTISEYVAALTDKSLKSWDYLTI